MEHALKSKIAELEAQSAVAAEEEDTKWLSTVASTPDNEPLKAKIAQLSKAVRTLKQENGSLSKRVQTLLTENDALTLENRKGATVQDKLQALCRELQARNKALIASEEAARAEDAAKRKELAEKFQGLVDDFSKRMEGHMEETARVSAENEKLKESLRAVMRAQALEKESFEATLKQKELEGKIAELKFEEKFRAGTEHILELQKAKTELAQAKMNEADLAARLADYGSKYEALRVSVSESTGFFDEFKRHRDDMDKKLKALVKERDGFARKCAGQEKALLEMADERIKSKQQLEALQAQKDKLQGLCRALQMERNELRKDLAVATAAAAPAPPSPEAAATAQASSDVD